MVATLRTTSAVSRSAPRTAPPRAAAAAPRSPTRRHLLAAALATAPSLLPPQPALAASLKSRLDSHDAAQLSKPYALSIPTELAYPPWLEGDWSALSTFAGYELPAKDKIERAELFAEPNVPGFAKTSIAFFPDVGRENVKFRLRWTRDDDGAVREDRAANYAAAMRGGLGYDALERVEYKTDAKNPTGFGSNTGNPNRIKLVFAPGLTQNAERIELFLNTRESEAPSPDLFYTAEEMRQVTFSRSGSVNGEYAHFASYRRLPSGNVDMTVLTAVYSDPLQLERFVVKVGPNRPLILFSHQLALTRA